MKHNVVKSHTPDKYRKSDLKSFKSYFCFVQPVCKTLIVGAVDGCVDDLVPVDRALNSTVLQRHSLNWNQD